MNPRLMRMRLPSRAPRSAGAPSEPGLHAQPTRAQFQLSTSPTSALHGAIQTRPGVVIRFAILRRPSPVGLQARVRACGDIDYGIPATVGRAAVAAALAVGGRCIG